LFGFTSIIACKICLCEIAAVTSCDNKVVLADDTLKEVISLLLLFVIDAESLSSQLEKKGL